MLQFLKQLLPNSPASQNGLRTSIAMVMAAAAALTLHLQDPFWACVSAIIIMQPFAAGTTERGWLRIIGTIVGAGLGFVLGGLVINHFLLYLLCCFSVITLAFYFSVTTAYPYGFLMVGVSGFMVLGSLLSHQMDIFYVAIWRCSEIITGVVCAWIATLFIFPQHAHTKIAELNRKNFQLVKEAIETIATGYLHQTNIHQQLYYLLDQLSQNINSYNDLAPIARHEFNATLFDTTIGQDFHDLNREILLSLRNFHNAYRDDLDYSALTDEPLLIDVFDELHSFFADLTAKLHDNNVAISSAALLDAWHHYQQEAKPTSTYAIEESVAAHTFVSNLNNLIQVLLNTEQFLRQMGALTKQDSIAKETPVFTPSFTAESWHYSIKAGLSVVVAIVTWLAINLPGGWQGVVSAIVLSIPRNIYDTRLFAELRLAGCLMGGGAGLVCLHFFYMSFPLLLMVLFVFGWLFSYIMFYKPKYAYAGLQANLALAITLVHVGGPPHSIAPALHRLTGILVGIGATFIVSQLFWPFHPKRMLEKNIRYSFTAIGQTFHDVVSGNLQDSADIHQRQIDFNSTFQRKRALLDSLKTYKHDTDSMISQLQSLLDEQKRLATITFCLATTVSIPAALAIDNQLTGDLTDVISTIDRLLNDAGWPDCEHYQHECQALLTRLDAILSKFRQQVPALQLPRHEITAFLYCISNLQNIVKTSERIQHIVKEDVHINLPAAAF
ncbi:MAG: hypothetical protein CMF50_04685 [Legionellales bacterium]|nr:hypothetical protein [Legionellales bacterium]|tara:strand:+ start:17540 stop:19711 length:2172 start_codon:yes stop_codon:yes gene_type:complete